MPKKPLAEAAGEFEEDIKRLRARQRKLQAGVLAATRAKSQLCRELIHALENAQARAAMKRGRKAAQRQIRRDTDFSLIKLW